MPTTIAPRVTIQRNGPGDYSYRAEGPARFRIVRDKRQWRLDEILPTGIALTQGDFPRRVDAEFAMLTIIKARRK